MENNALEPVIKALEQISRMKGDPDKFICLTTIGRAAHLATEALAAIQSPPEEIPGLGEAIDYIALPNGCITLSKTHTYEMISRLITAARKYHELTKKGDKDGE